MTTVDLLRDALRRDAEHAALPDHVAALRTRVLAAASGAIALPDTRTDIAPVRIEIDARSHRVRAWAIGIAGLAAALVATVVVAGFVASRDGGSGPAAAAEGLLPLDTYAFSVGADPGGLLFRYSGTSQGVQGGVWSRSPTSGGDATIDVLSGSAAQPVVNRPPDATTVTVAGTTGWSAPWDDYREGLYFALGGVDTLTAWRDDSSGLWVELATRGLDAGRVAQLAGTVRVADYHPVRVPVRLSWLPPGSTLTAVSDDGDHTGLVFGSHGGQFTLDVAPAGRLETDASGSAGPSPLVAGTFRGSYRSDDPATEVSDGRVDVLVAYGPGQAAAPGAPTAAMPRDELVRLLAGLTVADLDHRESWTDLSAALG